MGAVVAGQPLDRPLTGVCSPWNAAPAVVVVESRVHDPIADPSAPLAYGVRLDG